MSFAMVSGCYRGEKILSKRKKKNRNKADRSDCNEKSRSSAEVKAEEADDATQELTFDMSDFESGEASDPEEGSGAAEAQDGAETGELSDSGEDSKEPSEGEVNPEADDLPESEDPSEEEENSDAGDPSEDEETAEADSSSEAGENAEADDPADAQTFEDAEEAAPDESAPGRPCDEPEDDKHRKDGDEQDKKPEKKSVSRNALREQSENERIRREARHKRRIRQQVTAYIILVLMIAVIGAGLYFAVRYFVDLSRQRRADALAQEQALQQQLEEETAAQTQPVIEELPPAPTVEDLGPTPSERLGELISSEIAALTLEEKVQAIMFVTPESITGVDRVVVAGDGTRSALENFSPGGIVYSSRNVTSGDQFTTMMSNTLEMVSRPVFLATTETGMNESGLVGTGVIESVLKPSQVVETGNVEEAVNAGMTIGSGLQSIGITVDFAPLADLSVTNGGTGANTSYGDDAASVTTYVTGMAEGLYQSGVVPAFRYFPSLAASSQNPQNGRAVCDRAIEDFRSNEFQVWLSAINAGAMMIQMSNVIYPSIDSDSLPSSLSEKTVTGVLRDELGYDGVIISGPLNDAAITSYYTASESAVMALKSGCDMIYASPDPEAAAEGIIEAVGSGVISEERIDDALVRIYRIRYADTLAQYRAEYEAEAISMGVDLTGVQY